MENAPEATNPVTWFMHGAFVWFGGFLSTLKLAGCQHKSWLELGEMEVKCRKTVIVRGYRAASLAYLKKRVPRVPASIQQYHHTAAVNLDVWWQ